MTDGNVFGQAEIKSQGLGVIAKGGALILIGSFISIGVNFVYQFFLARLLGPSEVGIVNLGISIITLVSLVMVFGLDRTVVRYVTYFTGLDDHPRELGVINSALSILLVTTLVITPLLWLASPFLADQVFHKPDLLIVLRILCLSLPFIALTRVLLGVAQAYKRITPIVAIEQITVPVLRIAGLFILVLMVGASSPVAAQSYALAAILGCFPAILYGYQLYWRRRAGLRPQPVTREVLHFAWLAMLSIILNRTNTQTETLVLGAFSSSQQVGIYTVGLKATVFISIFLDALATVFTPFIAELYAKRDMLELGQKLKIVTRWAFSLALPVAIILYVESPDLMALLGPGFEPGVPVLRLLVIAQLAYVVLGPGGLILMMTDYNRLNLINAVLNLFLSLGLDLVLIPRYGAIGAAVAGAITIVFVNLLRVVQIHYHLHMHPYSVSFIKPVLAALGAAVASLLAAQWLAGFEPLFRLIGVAAITMAVYFLLILVMRLDDSDRELFRLLVRRLAPQPDSL